MQRNHMVYNRRDLALAVLVDMPEGTPRGLTVIMHGLGGFKEQPHIVELAAASVEQGFITVRFDAADSIGESAGSYEKATVTSYYHDLQDVIHWVEHQHFWHGPFVLMGHSLGAFCVALYAEEHPEKVRGLAPLATVVSGKTILDQWGPKVMEEWARTGFKVKESNSKPGVVLRLGLQFAEDCLQYDLLPKAARLEMPILMLVGDQDDSTPLETQQLFFKALPSLNRHLHLIHGAGHTIRDHEQLKVLKEIASDWLKEL